MKIAFQSFSLILIILLSFLLSCENEESLIGTDFITNNPHSLTTYDVVSDQIVSRSIPNINTSGSGNNNMLGGYFDPFFGKTKVGFSWQIRPTSNTIPSSLESISDIYISIPYLGHYGLQGLDSTQVSLDIDLYELKESILGNIYSLTKNDFNKSLITSTTKYLSEIQNENDSSLFINDLQIYNGFATSLFNALQVDGSDGVLSEPDLALLQNNFLSQFNGLNLSVSNLSLNPENGTILYMNTGSDEAILGIEFQNGNNETDTLEFEMKKENLNIFNHFEHKTSINDSTLLLQSMGGAYSIIDMAFLSNLKDSGYIGVNKAELILHLAESNGAFPKPDTLVLYEYLDSPQSNNTRPYPNNIVSYALWDSTNTQYTFNIVDHVQRVISEGETPAYRLQISSPESNVHRVVLNKTNKPVELNLLLIKEETIQE